MVAEALQHLFRMASMACGTNSGPLPNLFDPPVKCEMDALNNQTLALTSIADILFLIGNVVRILLALAGGFSIIVIIVASIYYVASAGEPSRILRARAILMNMAIGLVLIISAYAIVTYVAKGF